MTIKQYPYEVNSWIVLSENSFIKRMDKSTFKHRGTGIPKRIQTLWEVNDLKESSKIKVSFNYNNTTYEAFVYCDPRGRTRLHWYHDFDRVITEKYYELSLAYKSDTEVIEEPQLRFERVNKHVYDIDFIDIVTYDEIHENSSNYSEGKVIYAYSKKFERNPNVRKEAIAIHGLTCKACGFHFGKGYGKLGEGYIEVHHLKPLYENGKEKKVSIKDDLTTLCSNCHRMVHRKRNNVLAVDKLKNDVAFDLFYKW